MKVRAAPAADDRQLAGPDRAGGFALSPRGWLAVAAILAGIMLWASDGHLGPGGVPFLFLTWAAVIAAFTSRHADDPRRIERVLSVGILVQLVLLIARPPGQYLLPDLATHRVLAATFPAALAAITILSTSIVLERPLLGRATFPTIVAVFGAAVAWVLVASPHPWIDVIDFGRESALALARGQNPYDLHLPNIYGNTELFGPGFATDRSIDVGLVYPPLSLFLTAPGVYLVHDPRALLVVALVAAALFIDRLGGRIARLSALLFISSPRRFFGVEQGWTEPFLIAVFALTLLLARRRSRWLPVALAAMLGLKQFAVPLPAPDAPAARRDAAPPEPPGGRPRGPARGRARASVRAVGSARLLPLDGALPSGAALPAGQPELRRPLGLGARGHRRHPRRFRRSCSRGWPWSGRCAGAGRRRPGSPRAAPWSCSPSWPGRSRPTSTTTTWPSGCSSAPSPPAVRWVRR